MVEKRTRQLRHQALHDPLTDLPNRALILDRAEQMLLRARRNPLMVGALFIDLDEFKDVNDTYGHEVGDQLLKAVGARLSGSLRASDSVGRLGGDEFVVLVEGELGGDGPEVVARQLLDLFAQPFAIESDGVEVLRISASIGVALGPRSGAADLLRDADVALYVAKARGKHGYVVFRSQMKSFLSDRLGPEHDPREDTGTGEEPTGEAGSLFGPTEDRDDGVVSRSRTQRGDVSRMGGTARLTRGPPSCPTGTSQDGTPRHENVGKDPEIPVARPVGTLRGGMGPPRGTLGPSRTTDSVRIITNRGHRISGTEEGPRCAGKR